MVERCGLLFSLPQNIILASAPDETVSLFGAPYTMHGYAAGSGDVDVHAFTVVS